MMAVHGRIQREGEVVHLVAHRVTDNTLASVGSRDAASALPHGHGDQLRRGGSGPDPRELPTKELRTRDIHFPDLRVDTIKMKTREFR
jgi:error-prone DNA polymerase